MAHEPDDLKSLDDRLKAVRATVVPIKDEKRASLGQGFSMMNVGMTIVFSLAGGIFVGAIIGLFLDRWLGTSPWLLVVMLLFGSAAGVTTAVRMARELAESQPMAPDADPNTPNWDDDEDDEQWLHQPGAGDATKSEQ